MIPAATVERIKRLHAAKVSVREIQRMTGVSRNTIDKILSGKYDSSPISLHAKVMSGKFGRCPTCGGLVKLPCYSCWLKIEAAREKAVEELKRDRQEEDSK
jgi:hypothetical protein